MPCGVACAARSQAAASVSTSRLGGQPLGRQQRFPAPPASARNSRGRRSRRPASSPRPTAPPPIRSTKTGPCRAAPPSWRRLRPATARQTPAHRRPPASRRGMLASRRLKIALPGVDRDGQRRVGALAPDLRRRRKPPYRPIAGSRPGHARCCRGRRSRRAPPR